MYQRQGRFKEAEAILLAVHDSFARVLGAGHERTRETRRAIVALYERWKKPESAARWRLSPGLVP